MLDARGFQDVGLDDMKAWVESKGGRLVVQPGGRELTDEELAAVAGGAQEVDLGVAIGGTLLGVGIIVGVAAIAAG